VSTSRTDNYFKLTRPKRGGDGLVHVFAFFVTSEPASIAEAWSQITSERAMYGGHVAVYRRVSIGRGEWGTLARVGENFAVAA
jgi:hypothetical protein